MLKPRRAVRIGLFLYSCSFYYCSFLLVLIRHSKKYLSGTPSAIIIAGGYVPLYSVQLSCKTCNYSTTFNRCSNRPLAIPVTVLTRPGATFITQEIQTSTTAYNKAAADLKSKNSACQNLKDAKTKYNCLPCIVEKCKAKAESCNRCVKARSAELR